MRARPWLILAAMALARAAFGYQFQAIGSLAPDLMAAYGLDYTAVGVLIGAFVAPGIVLALPLGLLGRRFGEGLVVGGGLALMTLGPLVCALAGSPPGIAAGRMLSGAGGVAMIVLQSKIISDWFVGRRFLAAISVSVAAYPVGVAAAQIVLPLLAGRGGVGLAFLSAAALTGLTGLVFAASYRPPPDAAASPRGFSLPSRRECALVMLAGLIWTAYTGGYGGFVAYVPSLMSAQGQPAVLTGVVMTIATLGSAPATLLGGSLAARFGGLRVFLFGTVAAAIGCVAIALTDWPIVSAVLFGVAGSLPAAAIMAAGTLSARPEHRAVGMGLFYTTYYVGNAVAPAACGRAADLLGHPAGALYAAGVIGLFAVPLWFLHARVAAGGSRGPREPRQPGEPRFAAAGPARLG